MSLISYIILDMNTNINNLVTAFSRIDRENGYTFKHFLSNIFIDFLLTLLAPITRRAVEILRRI